MRKWAMRFFVNLFIYLKYTYAQTAFVTFWIFPDINFSFLLIGKFPVRIRHIFTVFSRKCTWIWNFLIIFHYKIADLLKLFSSFFLDIKEVSKGNSEEKNSFEQIHLDFSINNLCHCSYLSYDTRVCRKQ